MFSDPGKLVTTRNTAGLHAIHPPNRLIITDQKSGIKFVVDRGATKSVIGRSSAKKLSTIFTRSTRSMAKNKYLRRTQLNIEYWTTTAFHIDFRDSRCQARYIRCRVLEI